MKMSLVVCLLSGLLAMMISGAVSLPPDFFRAGRGDSIPAGKRASTELKLFEDACNFCTSHDPQLSLPCQQSAGVQKVCLMAYATELHSFLDKKGWA
jgi:hypothetical protein